MAPFVVTVHVVDGRAVVLPVGELDVATAPELERALLGVLTGEHWTVILDLSSVTFADCAGVIPVRRALRQASEVMTSVRLCGASPAVRRVLELTDLLPDGQGPGGRAQALAPT